MTKRLLTAKSFKYLRNRIKIQHFKRNQGKGFILRGHKVVKIGRASTPGLDPSTSGSLKYNYSRYKGEDQVILLTQFITFFDFFTFYLL